MTASASPRSRAPSSSSSRRAFGWIVVAAQRDRSPPDPLDQREQLGAGLLRDHLAEQRAEEADLRG